MKFSGSDYVKTRDNKRLSNALAEIVEYMRDGRWHTAQDVAWKIGNQNVPSVEAQIRNVRKLGYPVERRNRNDVVGCSEYRLIDDKKPIFKEEEGQLIFC